MSDDRLAQARAEAERRWFPGHDHEDCIKCGIDVQVREGFELGAVWADANPQPRMVTHDDMGAAYAAFMEAEGHPVRRLIVAFKAAGIEVCDE